MTNIKDNTIFIGDNLKNLDKIENNTISICYIDPPYNTGNTYSYLDKESVEIWRNKIINRIKKIKTKMVKNGVVLFSIGEESLFEAHNILKQEFNYVFEPLIWQTKNSLNQNKVSNISSINCEFILVASDEKIKTNSELITDKGIIQEKHKNYPLSIILDKDIKEYPLVKHNGKKIRVINDYTVTKKKNIDKSFQNHSFQKRTAQKGHGAYRYIEQVKGISGTTNETLYYIEGVKDKQGLGGKFIIGNSYFQSIGSEIRLKMPNFLGFYQGGIAGFQTAKPINLMKRLFKAFNIYDDCKVIDLYSGSGNVIKALNELNINFFGFELGGIDDKSLTKLKENTKDIKKNHFQ